MKPHLPVRLFRALLALMGVVSSTAVADIYVCAEGVNYDNLSESTRFYDYGKGSYTWANKSILEYVNQQYQETGSFDFLGDLADRLPEGITVVDVDSFSELYGDSLLCWACSASNIIQYWQTYYGPLYKGDKELPYGYTYDPEYMPQLYGAQSNRVGLVFHDNWNDVAGNFYNAIRWYCQGNDTNSGLITTGKGGYWAGQVISYDMVIGVTTGMEQIQDILMNGLGYEIGDSGKYELTHVGRISQLGITQVNAAIGHAITCYGVVLNDDGSLKGIIVADSDDFSYKLSTYYLKKDEDGYAKLYRDEACTSSWGNYYLHSVSYFDGTKELKQARSLYYDKETPLYWSGEAESWTAHATEDTIPYAQSGWKVSIEGTDYNSFFHTGRKVVFDDNATDFNVIVEGEHEVADLILNNNIYEYHFTTESTASIKTNSITITGSGSALFHKLNIQAQEVSYGNYSITLGSGASLTADNFQLNQGGSLRIANAGISTQQFTLNSGASLEFYGDGNSIQLGNLTLHNGAQLYINTEISSTPLSGLTANSVTGNTWEVQFSDEIYFSESSYKLFTLGGNVSLWEGVFTSSVGDFEIKDNVLYFIPEEYYQVLTWSSGNGVWSSKKWHNSEVDSSDSVVYMSGSSNYTVSIQDVVSAKILEANNTQGTITLSAVDGNSCISGDMRLVKKNGGTFIVNTTNTYTGGTKLYNGTLKAGNAQAFGTGSIATLGGTLHLNNYAVENDIIIKGDTIIQGGSAYNGSLRLENGHVSGGEIKLRQNAELQSGSISNKLSGTGMIVKTGSDIVTLSGNNSFTGGTLITEGKLEIAHASALGSGAVVLENGTLSVRVNGFSNKISTAGNSTIQIIQGCELILNEALKNTGTLTLSGSIKADSLLLSSHSSGRVDALGNYGSNGFAVTSTHSTFTVVNGGTTIADDLILTHNGAQYVVEKSGIARPTGTNYFTPNSYQANSGHTVRLSDAIKFSGGALSTVQLRGGTLYVDDVINYVNAQGGTIYLESGELKGYLPNAKVYASGGIINASMGNSTSFTASGNVVLNSQSNNSHTGGTTLNGGYYTLAHCNFFGNGSIITTGETTLDSSESNFTWGATHHTNLRKIISNSGTLTMIGTFNASELSLISNGANYYVNAQGQIGTSGFSVSGGYSVKLVEGGTLIANATVIHGDLLLTLHNDGYARQEGSTDYTTYYLTGNDTARVSEAETYSAGAMQSIVMSGGTLYADEEATVTATGGNILLSKGILSGTAQNTVVSASGGTLNTRLSGSGTLTITGDVTIDAANTHTGGTVINGGNVYLGNANALSKGPISTAGSTTITPGGVGVLYHVINNTGTLTLNGTFYADALTLNSNGVRYIDLNGNEADSGFAQDTGYSVQVVNGGTVTAGTIIKHGEHTLVLGSNGYATEENSNGEVSYDTYYLNGTDIVSVIAAKEASSNALTTIRMSGGTLLADASTEAAATGGSIILSSGTLSGTATNAEVTAKGGVLTATLAGSSVLTAKGAISISGANTHTGGTILNGGNFTLNNTKALGNGAIICIGINSISTTANARLNSTILNSGTLTLNGTFDASALALHTISSCYVDENGHVGSSGFRQSTGYSVQVVNGGSVSGNASIKHGSRTLTLGNDGYATSGGSISYGTYYLNGTDSMSVSKAETASANALTSISMTGGTLYADASTKVTATGGNIIMSSGILSGTIQNTDVNAKAGTLSAVISGTGSLTAKGTMTISGANTHTGITLLNGGTFSLNNASALGNGAIMTVGTNTLKANTTITLNHTILNSGALTLSGTYNASALTLTTVNGSYVDTNGNTSGSGFRKAEGYKVQIVSGGTVNSGATIKHGSLTLTLGSDGYATGGGGVTYSTYYLNSGASVKVSEAESASSNALTTVSMAGGTLYADASTKVSCTGGNIVLSSGTLSGTVKDAHITASAGTLSATLSGTTTLSAKGTMTISGSNTHTGGTIFNGGTFTLNNAKALGNGSIMTIGTNTLKANTKQTLTAPILNSGTLTLRGTWDISALAINTQAATYVNTQGYHGDSGFRETEKIEVRVVSGGSTKASGLILTHSRATGGLTLGNDGIATSGGAIDYSIYYLTGRDYANTAAIEYAADGELDHIAMSGGTLTVDSTNANIQASAGDIEITQGCTLSGAISGASIEVSANSKNITISADISDNSNLIINGGNISLTGYNSYTGSTAINKGSLTIGNAAALSGGHFIVNGSTLNLNNYTTHNTISLYNGKLTGSVGFNGNLTVGGDSVTVDNGYHLSSGKTLTIASGGAVFHGDLTLSGGTLLFEGAALYTQGDVLFSDNITTLVDLSQWKGELTDGQTLAVFGDSVKGWADNCLQIIGSNEMHLSFDTSTGTLTLKIEGQHQESEVISWLGASKAVWQHGKAGWMNATTGYDAVFENGMDVIFTQAGNVTIAGAVEPGSLIVAGDKAITFKSDKATPGRIVGEGSLTKRGNGKLTLNDGNTYSGGTLIEAGTVIAGGASSFGTGDITLKGGTLDLKGKAVVNDICLEGAATIKAGKLYGGSVALNGDLLKGSLLNVASGETATLNSGTMDGTLSGVGTVAVTGEAAVGTAGKITTDKLDIDGTLAVSSKGLAMNTKASTVTVNKGGLLTSEGALKAYAMYIKGGAVEVNGLKASSVALTGNLQLSSAGSMSVFGNVSAGNITLSGKSYLSLSGKLSATNLTLNSTTLSFTAPKLTTVAVKNTLTLRGTNTVVFDFDATSGSTYKLFTFAKATYSGSLETLLGWTKNSSYTLTDTGKAITLTVNDADAWEAYMDSLLSNTAEAAVASDTAEDLLFAPTEDTAALEPELAKVADTLVQSTWGTVGASRAFGDTIANRGAHATLLDGGKGAAWISTMGGSSRISSDGAHAGADYTLTGAALGMEAHIGEGSTLGLAIGNSWGKVSTFSAYPVDQDSTHMGIYGNHKLSDTLSLSWMAAHTRTESEVNLAGLPCSWSQNALQLDARLTWAKALTARTTVNAFGGLQYLATDSGESNGIKTGSLQNLRAEIGVGATHQLSGSTLAYGELSFVGDMVRNNPTADLGGIRSHGANPGRAGMNLSMGASHRLNTSWSVNASYNFELMQNITSHSLNIGATYSF